MQPIGYEEKISEALENILRLEAVRDMSFRYARSKRKKTLSEFQEEICNVNIPFLISLLKYCESHNITKSDIRRSELIKQRKLLELIYSHLNFYKNSKSDSAIGKILVCIQEFNPAYIECSVLRDWCIYDEGEYEFRMNRLEHGMG